MNPLLRELISLIDSMTDLRRILSANKATVPSEAISLTEALEASLNDIVARQGVTRMSDKVLALDLRRQKIVRIEHTPIPKNGEIIAIVRGGYERDGRVLRLQELAVRKVE